MRGSAAGDLRAATSHTVAGEGSASRKIRLANYPYTVMFRNGRIAPPITVTSVPSIDELRAIKKFVFQLESTSPDVKAAATKACEKLTALHGSKGYTFTVEYGVK